jgi:hypothetical protein
MNYATVTLKRCKEVQKLINDIYRFLSVTRPSLNTNINTLSIINI